MLVDDTLIRIVHHGAGGAGGAGAVGEKVGELGLYDGEAGL
jgi:hypothetical protein